MLLIKSSNEVKKAISFLKNSRKTIGFVPTMGALHNGHISLIKQSKAETDITLCSIFINPLQFNNEIDLNTYPIKIENDIEMLINEGVDLLFLPDKSEIYPKNFKPIDFSFDGLDLIYEGKLRPGHFMGVANVLKIFFEIIEPNYAYFGQKDYQQTLIVKKMIESLKIPISIKVCEIVREENGLAMSSRNVRLNETFRKNSGFLFKILNELKEDLNNISIEKAIELAKNKIALNAESSFEYIEVLNRENLEKWDEGFIKNQSIILTAVKYGNVRLLDNILI